MTNLTFTIDPDGRAQRFLQEAADAIRDLTPALREIKDYQLKTIGEQFDTEGSKILGTKWAKRKKAYSHPILNKTGKLRGSPAQESLTSTRLTITSRTPYYKYHQQGTRTVPQRQIMGHSEEMQIQAVDIVANHINSKLKKYG